MTIPAVPVPPGGKIRRTLDLKLKAGWRFDDARKVFLARSGQTFEPRTTLPKKTKVASKVPSLAAADEARLSSHERELRRYVQIILPAGESPEDYLEIVRGWPPVEQASASPVISLPSGL